MTEFGSFPLTRTQEADDFHTNNRDLFQIQGDVGTEASHLVCNLTQMLGPHTPDQANCGSFSIQMSFDLQHPLVTPTNLWAKEAPPINVLNSNGLPHALDIAGRNLLIFQKRMLRMLIFQK